MSGFMKAAIIAAYKERGKLSVWVLGILAYNLFVYAFDYMLYPYVIWKLGLVRGFVIMSPSSFGICWLTLVFYDWMKRDWIAIETIKKLREYEGQSKTIRFLSKVLEMSDPAAMLILSIWKDPFICTAYMRKGTYQYNGLTRRDWKILIASVFISNIYWTLVNFGAIQIVLNYKNIWGFIIKLMQISQYIT